MSTPQIHLETLPRSIQLLMVLGFLALAAFPFIGTDFYTAMVVRMMILAILAMSLDLLQGVTGLVSLGHAAYLLATWHPSQRPATLELDAHARWLGLAIRQHRKTGPDTAEVEFVARFRLAGRAVRQHERSRFVREDGRWWYVDGDVL